MTLILTVNGPETIWLLADRRMSYSDGRPHRDYARKLMFLDTTDASAILGYSGLGETVAGTEPADWMAQVLRGPHYPLEVSLQRLANATTRQLPDHLLRMKGTAGSAHYMVATAFLGGEAKVYSIDLVFPPDRKDGLFRFTRHSFGGRQGGFDLTPAVYIGGSGALFLYKDRSWYRPLLRLARACDKQKVSPNVVADHLAALNTHVHGSVPSVGHRCIVAWRNRNGGVHCGGGGESFYNGVTPESAAAYVIPRIANGVPLSDVFRLTTPFFHERARAHFAGEKVPPMDEAWAPVKAELERLPDTPDEKLK